MQVAASKATLLPLIGNHLLVEVKGVVNRQGAITAVASRLGGSSAKVLRGTQQLLRLLTVHRYSVVLNGAALCDNHLSLSALPWLSNLLQLGDLVEHLEGIAQMLVLYNSRSKTCMCV